MTSRRLTGAEDRVAVPQHGAALARRIRNRRNIELSGAAHGLTIQRAEEVNVILLHQIRSTEQVRDF